MKRWLWLSLLLLAVTVSGCSLGEPPATPTPMPTETSTADVCLGQKYETYEGQFTNAGLGKLAVVVYDKAIYDRNLHLYLCYSNVSKKDLKAISGVFLIYDPLFARSIYSKKVDLDFTTLADEIFRADYAMNSEIVADFVVDIDGKPYDFDPNNVRIVEAKAKDLYSSFVATLIVYSDGTRESFPAP